MKVNAVVFTGAYWSCISPFLTGDLGINKYEKILLAKVINKENEPKSYFSGESI